ncbi:MAG TPA: lysophospholipid acyltransferase family protein [Smithella sp.]|nr:lysophospholipid acyltransferase family protein [Smithella sp.]
MHYTMFNTPVVKSVLRGVALVLLKLLGWKAAGKLPREKKYVLIVAPHTSNWDLFYGILLAFTLKLDARYIAKKELFRGPFACLMRWSGAIPVDRASSHHVVEQMAAAFRKSEKFVLALAPEGTRRRKEFWKSGFYHIALSARVPILLGYIDYAGKCGGAGPLIHPTGNEEEDMRVIRDFYQTVRGKHPENTSPVVLHS